MASEPTEQQKKFKGALVMGPGRPGGGAAERKSENLWCRVSCHEFLDMYMSFIPTSSSSPSASIKSLNIVYTAAIALPLRE